jgi:hypothetical protein
MRGGYRFHARKRSFDARARQAQISEASSLWNFTPELAFGREIELRSRLFLDDQAPNTDVPALTFVVRGLAKQG